MVGVSILVRDVFVGLLVLGISEWMINFLYVTCDVLVGLLVRNGPLSVSCLFYQLWETVF